MKHKESRLLARITARIPGLKLKLRQAGMTISPEQFVAQVITSSLFMTLLLGLGMIMVFSKMENGWIIAVVSLPIIFFIMMSYFLQLPVVKQKIIEREMEREIVYASRFLMIELSAGVPLYQAFINIVRNYERIGVVFRRIVEGVDLGSSMEDALEEAINTCPSENVRKLIIQIKNSLQSGADVSHSLAETTRQVTQEQIIAVKEYGRKLNPYVMFFMMIAVIMPSLGTTAFIVLASFMKITVDLTILLIGVGFIGFMQFMFFQLIKSSRPPVDL